MFEISTNMPYKQKGVAVALEFAFPDNNESLFCVINEEALKDKNTRKRIFRDMIRQAEEIIDEHYANTSAEK